VLRSKGKDFGIASNKQLERTGMGTASREKQREKVQPAWWKITAPGRSAHLRASNELAFGGEKRDFNRRGLHDPLRREGSDPRGSRRHPKTPPDSIKRGEDCRQKN